MSPVLAGGFLTTAPPGKSRVGCLLREGFGWICIWVPSITGRKAWSREGQVLRALPELLLASLSLCPPLSAPP